MNFNIVESDSTKEFNEMYEQIKVDLDNGLLVREIMEKHGLSHGKWRKYYKQLVQDGLKEPKKREQYAPKYYCLNKNRYVVQKFYDKKKYHIGSFKNESDAQKCVRLMKECDWDLTQRERIINEIKNNGG